MRTTSEATLKQNRRGARPAAQIIDRLEEPCGRLDQRRPAAGLPALMPARRP